MFYFLVYAKPIYIQLVRNSELFGKIFVNENDLCEWKCFSVFFYVYVQLWNERSEESVCLLYQF